MLTKEWIEKHHSLGRPSVGFVNWQFAKNKRGYYIIRGIDLARSCEAVYRVARISEMLILEGCLYALLNGTLLMCRFKDHAENLSDLEIYWPVYHKKLKTSSVSVEDLFSQIKSAVESKIQERKDLLESCIPAEEKAIIFSLNSEKDSFADFFAIKGSSGFTYYQFEIKNNRVCAYDNDKLLLSYFTRLVPAKNKYADADKNYVIIESLLVPSEKAAYLYNAKREPLYISVKSKTYILYEGDLIKLK